MRLKASAMLAVLAALLATAAGGCTPSPVNQLISVDGQPVTLHYTVGSQPRPLVLALHGIGSTGDEFAAATGLSAFADNNNFVIAYPDAHVAPDMPSPIPDPTPTPTASPTPAPAPTPAPTPAAARYSAGSLNFQRAQLAGGFVEDARAATATATSGRAWNAGVCCGGSTFDDVTYLRHVVAAVAVRTNIDLHRVYVIGLSNGGMMAERAVCQAPTVFAAAGSVAGPYLGKACSRPVWRQLHDGHDPVVPFYGGVPPGSLYLHLAPNWCLCTFPDSATEAHRFPGGAVSVRLVPAGVHNWPRLNDGSWNLDGNQDLWNFVSVYRL